MSESATNPLAENADPKELFSIQWIRSFIDGYFQRRGKDPSMIDIVDLKIQKNAIQGILSTAYLVDVLYKDSNPPLGIHFIFLFHVYI